MSEQTNSVGEGILKGLKRILFHTEDNPPDNPNPVPPVTSATPPAPANPAVHSNAQPAAAPGLPMDEKAMKLRVYQLLESMNQPGVDFFEVWNAAVEMGGANNADIKAAFTSLRFADKSLNKSKLVQTADFYIGKIKGVLDAERAKRAQEKETLLRDKAQSRASLESQIELAEKQLADLQNHLVQLKTERDNVDSRFAPKIADIETKITQGRHAVTSVIDEMTAALQIIEREID